ncbi:glycine cleavage system protein GcvH [Mobilicoccus pelagius]|uniref:Glycine cleavage system H protein n=1 Tax=Mobilicoccus pelagius NBRC 104925 TaxID=1089455 RepID=H5UPD7_9MICO|nr:glycine cleavage system protein GcvH [Mobilicoccus pelagius]GAB47595.1 glycine cleavage system H protein [Mobilicoccus pelagius NBRC 104925]
MSDLEYPQELRYTAEHEWVRTGNDDVVRVGITSYAQDALGDVVYVDLPSVGDEVTAGDTCGEIESTKSVSDLFSPLTGEVVAVNEGLESASEMVNSDPYGEGWMFELRVSDRAQLDSLMDADTYTESLD